MYLVCLCDLQMEKERQLRERERILREEQERIKAETMIREQRRLQDEHQRRMREEQQRRIAAAAAKEAEEQQRLERERRLREKEERERVERERAEREKQERERRERERKERQEEERVKREREEREREQKREMKRDELQTQRLGKRAYSEAMGFELPGAKRLSTHDSSRSSDSYGSPSSVFGRLAPPTQKHSPEVSALQKTQEYRRAGPSASQSYERSGRVSDGSGYSRSGGTSQIRSTSRDTRPESSPFTEARGLPVSQSAGLYFGKASTGGMYDKPGGSIYGKPPGNVYGKVMSGVVGAGVPMQDMLKQQRASANVQVTPDLLTAATQVLQNFQKLSGGVGVPLPGASHMRAGPTIQQQLQQLAGVAGVHSSMGGGAGVPPGYISMASRTSMSGGSGGIQVTRYPLPQGAMGGGVMVGKPRAEGQQKIPSEEERYNRRFPRPPPHQVRPSTGYNKRLV